MLFKKKKDVDLEELEKKGMLRVIKKERNFKTDREGFVNLSEIKKSLNEPSKKSVETSSFNFFDNPVVNETEKDFYSKREVDRKIEELDNKIYKLEQRIELLERKLGVGNFSGFNY